jgi:hypothetical protein
MYKMTPEQEREIEKLYIDSFTPPNLAEFRKYIEGEWVVKDNAGRTANTV